MPHIRNFDPPLRQNRHGPILRLPVMVELPAHKLDSVGVAGTQTKNLLDRVTFGMQPRSLDQLALLLTCGLVLSPSTSPDSFLLDPTHIHRTDDTMQPETLLTHSRKENKQGMVPVAASDEANLVAVLLARELGFSAFLSAVKTIGGTDVSTVTLSDGEISVSFVLSGTHPSVSQFTVFDDTDVGMLLSLLHTLNELKVLVRDTRLGLTEAERSSHEYAMLVAKFELEKPEHHLAELVDREFHSLRGILSLPKVVLN